eukprot:CAMPEP_0114565478 /NCGR_PEP_ID=MMETSP0114-20121206/14329_1 /TAXON_ID=31324 /ORGANISM="Goniomonas sp, Strain m" /LENGTH=596 /DNA_ID=CAMNT_0001751723 /DNA_START=15 /DNA_END=1805 /DNA_ORIENTATION=+
MTAPDGEVVEPAEDLLLREEKEADPGAVEEAGQDVPKAGPVRVSVTSEREPSPRPTSARSFQDQWDEFGFVRSNSARNSIPCGGGFSHSLDDEKFRNEWSKYVRDLQLNPLRDIPKTRSLKLLVRHGIPNEYRGQFWTAFAGTAKAKARYPPGYYEHLLRQAEAEPDTQAIREIDRDVYRTFPGHRVYATTEGSTALRRVLVAFSVHSPVVGYCQSLNYLAAMLLLFVNEEEAFWTLCVVVEDMLPPSYYAPTMDAALADQSALEDCVRACLPTLMARVGEQQVELRLITLEWFLCIFVNCLPLEFLLRVWDVFFFEGAATLFRVSVALLRSHEAAIVKETSHHDMFACIRNLGMGSSLDEVFKLAFGWQTRLSRTEIRHFQEARGVGRCTWENKPVSTHMALLEGPRHWLHRQGQEIVQMRRSGRVSDTDQSRGAHSESPTDDGDCDPAASMASTLPLSDPSASPTSSGLYTNTATRRSVSQAMFSSLPKSLRPPGSSSEAIESLSQMKLGKHSTICVSHQDAVDQPPPAEQQSGRLFRAPSWFVATKTVEGSLEDSVHDDYQPGAEQESCRDKALDGEVFDSEALASPLWDHFH